MSHEKVIPLLLENISKIAIGLINADRCIVFLIEKN